MDNRPSWWRPRDARGRFTSLGGVHPSRFGRSSVVRDDEIAERLTEAMNDGAEEAIERVIAEIVIAAKADVPVGDPALDPDPTVTLRDSFIVYWVGNVATIAVVAPYAVKQHEATHFKHPRGGRAKFLERHVAGSGPLLQKELGNIRISKEF